MGPLTVETGAAAEAVERARESREERSTGGPFRGVGGFATCSRRLRIQAIIRVRRWPASELPVTGSRAVTVVRSRLLGGAAEGPAERARKEDR